jgi:endo-1,4-beta-xylanase
VELIRKLKAAGAAITGVGLQGHVRLDRPDARTEADTIGAFAALGIRVNISELDAEVLPRAIDPADVSAAAGAMAQSNSWPYGLPEDMQQKLAKRYAELFRVFVQHHEVMGCVTFWGVTDGDSWLNNFPTRGRTNYPLLLDREGKPKPAFTAVIHEGATH